MKQPASGFRHDINALRALAVGGVLAFHFLPLSTPGGFAGVDVFFVISGYLMTSIIVSAIDNNRFSLIQFYMMRVTRIIPALLVLGATLLAAGLVLLPPPELTDLALHVAAAAAFVSNIVFWQQADYFDTAAHEKWLLHTWSLAVEWQFYLIYPLIILAVVRWLGRRRLFAALSILALVSLAIGFAMALLAPVGAFYLLPGRVWEMVAGGLVFLASPHLPAAYRRGVAYAATALVAASYWILAEDMMWPGPGTLLPVVATALVLIADARDDALFANPIMNWVGSRSYSIYLWHWPFVVAGNYLQISADPKFVMTGLLLTMICAEASYRVVEQRRGFFAPRGPGWRAAALSPAIVSAAAIAAVGSGLFALQGIPSRMPQAQRQALARQDLPRRSDGYCYRSFLRDKGLEVTRDAAECLLGAPGAAPTVLLMGDSHAASYEPLWDELGKKAGFSVASATTNWCFPSASKDQMPRQSPQAAEQCLVNRAHLVADARSYGYVVLAAAWYEVAKVGLIDQSFSMARALAGEGVQVVLMPSPKRYDTDVTARARVAMFDHQPFDAARLPDTKDDEARAVNARLAAFAAATPGVTFLPREAVFGTAQSYRSGDYVLPISYDGSHIAAGASAALGRSGPCAAQFGPCADLIGKIAASVKTDQK